MRHGRHAIIKRAKIRRCREAWNGKCYYHSSWEFNKSLSDGVFAQVPLSTLSELMDEVRHMLVADL